MTCYANETANSLFTLRIDRTETGLVRVGDWVDDLVATLGLGEPADFAVRLCAEEAVANLVMHAVPIPGIDANWVVLEAEGTAEWVYLRVLDCCAPFDPLTVPPRTAEDPGIENRVGGFGVTLLRHYARDVRYCRDGDTNRLTLTIDRTPA